jgi:hypothetical protein
MDTHSEQWRRITEARHYLRQGITSQAAVDELCARISKKRGNAAANQLRQDMREQWQARQDWL